jgi:hypothetical protein
MGASKDGEQPHILSLRCPSPTYHFNLFSSSRESSGMLFTLCEV